MGRLDRVPRVEGQKSGSITATRRTRVLAGNRPGLTPTSWSTTPDTGHPESPEEENRTMSSTSKNPGPLARKVQAAIAGTVQATPAKPARPEPGQPKPVATNPAKATEPAKVKPPKPEPAVVVTAPPKPPERKCQPRWTEPDKQGDLVWEQPGRDELTETCQNVSEIPTAEPNPGLVIHGRLVRVFQGWNNRPMLVLEVPRATEQCAGKKHRRGVRWFPWRYDWPVTAETASRRSTAANGYRGMNVWLTIDPDKLAESEETWRTAKAELTQWHAALAAKKAAKIAAEVDSGGAGS